MSASRPKAILQSVTQCNCPQRKSLSLSSRTNLQVLVLVLGPQVLVLVLVLEPQVLESNTGRMSANVI